MDFKFLESITAMRYFNLETCHKFFFTDITLDL